MVNAFAFSATQTIAGRARADEQTDSALETINALTAAYNASGYQLFAQFRKEPGNIVFSPYSIGTALAMALSGARSATEQELTKVLMQHLTRSQIETANEKACAILQSYDRTADSGYCPEGMHLIGQQCETSIVDGDCPFLAIPKDGKCVGAPIKASARLSIANGLMITPGSDTAILPAYIILVEKKYAAEVFHDATVEQINAWVAHKTDGKIANIIDKAPGDTAAILLNAIYFQARWDHIFTKSATDDEDFYISPNVKIKTAMMHQKSYFPLLSGPGYQAIRLPFSIPELSMIVVRPEKMDGLSEIADHLDASAQAQLFKALSTSPRKAIDLALPKFKFSFGADLVEAYKQAGLHVAVTDNADFGGIIAKPRGIKIDQISHRATFEVTEDGIEATAVTSVTFRYTSGTTSVPVPKYEPFFVDRPFLFFVHDSRTQAVLFEGCFVKPSHVANNSATGIH